MSDISGLSNEEIATLDAILSTHRLGKLKTAAKPARGSVNRCLIVNDELVIRFQVRDLHLAKLRSEQIALDRLAGSVIPVPRAVVLDESCSISPHPYLITTKLLGDPVIDVWPRLSLDRQAAVAREAGGYLAQIHNFTFERYGQLVDVFGGHFASLWDYVYDFFDRYARILEAGLLTTTEDLARLERLILRASQFFKTNSADLVHSDYHWENLLTNGDRITAILDFEWALGGDAANDFHIEFKWHEMCPGSVQPLREGYQSVRPLASDHHVRRRLYTLLLHVESLAAWTDNWSEKQIAGERDKMLVLADELEAEI